MMHTKNNNMNRIYYFVWYFFFSAYWSAYELGEKANADKNASYLTGLNIGWNLFGLCEIILYNGYPFSTLFMVISCLIPAVSIPYFLTSDRKNFLEKMNKFTFLRDSKFKRTRYLTLFGTTLWSIAFVAGVAVLRNIYNTL